MVRLIRLILVFFLLELQLQLLLTTSTTRHWNKNILGLKDLANDLKLLPQILKGLTIDTGFKNIKDYIVQIAYLLRKNNPMKVNSQLKSFISSWCSAIRESMKRLFIFKVLIELKISSRVLKILRICARTKDSRNHLLHPKATRHKQ